MGMLATSGGSMLAGTGGLLGGNAAVNFTRPPTTTTTIGEIDRSAAATTLYSGVMVAIQQATPREVDQYGSLGLVISHKAYCQPTATFNPTTLRQGDVMDDGTTQYQVIRPQDMGGQSRAFCIFCNLKV